MRYSRIFLAAILGGLFTVAIPAAEILTNREVIEMHGAGLSEAVIREKIANSENIFDMSARALIELQKNNVPETLIQLMQQESLKTQRKMRAKIAAEMQNLIAESEEQRRAANVYLKKVAAPALPQLREGLNHHNPTLRAAVAEVLGKLNDSDSAPMLRELLTDNDEKVRHAAAESLTLLKDQRALEIAKTALRSDQVLADGYLHLLGGLRDGSAAELIAKRLLRSNMTAARAQAAWALGEIGDEASVGALSEALQHDNESEVKIACTQALGKIAAAESFATLTEICRHQPLLRTTALAAIGNYPPKIAVPFLIGALAQTMKPEERQIVLQNLRQLIGRDFGDDLEAWNKWLTENQATLSE